MGLLMMVYRIISLGIAGVSAAAMLYVGLYQSRFVDRLICPIFKDGCEGVADAPFARPFGIPDGYIGAGLYASSRFFCWLRPNVGSGLRFLFFRAWRPSPTLSVCAT